MDTNAIIRALLGEKTPKQAIEENSKRLKQFLDAPREEYPSYYRSSARNRNRQNQVAQQKKVAGAE